MRQASTLCMEGLTGTGLANRRWAGRNSTQPMHAPLHPRTPPPAPHRPVLLVLHQEHSIPGRIGHYLTKMGVPLDVRRPRFGDPLPETLADHAGAVIFGGPQSANDTDDFIRREIDWIAVPLAESKPFLGICLGAQMMAKHLGARVAYHPEGKAEVGYYPIRVTEAAHAVWATGRPWSINGTVRASICRTAPSCSPRATSFRSRRCATATALPSSFTPRSPTP